MAKQEEIYQIQQQYSAELAQQEFEMNMTLLDSVRNYLQRLNVKAQYDYILNYNASGSILQAKGNFDITEDVLQGLNSEYQAKYGESQEK
jgi:outer membrane protein